MRSPPIGVLTPANAASAPPRARPHAVARPSLAVLFFWLMAGEVVLTLMDQVEPKILPLMLKRQGASDEQIAFLVGSVAALLNFFINPVVSYRSDRKRSPLGRRIPYLLWAAPAAALAAALLPFAPQFAQALARAGWGHPPAILVYGGIVVLYQSFHLVVSSIYFYLFRDVVPVQHLGTFLAFLRVFGAVATFLFNYWLIGWSEGHTRAVFIGIGAAYAAGFLLLCLFVREGRYPPIVDTVPPRDDEGRCRAWLRAARNFAVESYRAPIYRWTYFSRSMIYAVIPVSSFFLFFPQRELGLSLDCIGKLLSWSALAWLPLAYPIGRLTDRWGPVRMLTLALGFAAAAHAASFFLVTGKRSFLASSLVISSAFWMVMLAQNLLAQTLFHPSRMGQLSAANSMVKALLIAAVIGPGTGWVLERLQGFRAVLSLPGLGSHPLGPYRFVYLLSAALYLLALFGLRRVRRHWLRLGGPAHYAPPI